MSKIINRKLDMTPGGVMLVIHTSQYDSDFTIVFSLYNSDGTFTIESGTTARIRGTKKSGTGYSVPATVDASAKTVTVAGDQQMTAVAGTNIYEIVLYRNNLEICSANFILAVERAALDKDTITDNTVVPELERLDEYIEQAAEYGAREGAAYAESWAVGGTGKRPDEDTNNAKYWAEQAAVSANTATTAKTDAETARDAAAQSASEAAASAESIDPETLEHRAYGAYVVEFASGTIASFADGADSIPMKDVLVHIDPVQAGSGDPSLDNVRPITGWTGVQIWDDPTYGGLINWNQKLKNPHFDEGTNGLQYWTSYNMSVSNLEDGSVSLTITDVHETQSFYNLFKQDLATITTKQHKFLVLWDYKPAHTHNVNIFLQRHSGASGNHRQVIDNVPAGEWNRLAYFVPAQDKTFDQLQLALNTTVNSGYSVGDVDYIRYPQMFDLTEMFGAGNEPTTLDEFKALFPKDCYDYNSEVTCVSAVSGEPHTHVQVSWQSEVGTVYGGTLDVTRGVLTVDRAIIASYAGETLPSTWISDRDVYSAGATPTTGAQVVYKLATPITYHLTPQEITSLLGENNLWADTGDSEVEYRADTKLYVDSKIAELQALVLENNGGN